MSDSESADVIFKEIRFPKKWNLPAGSKPGDEEFLGALSMNELIPELRSKKKPKRKKSRKGKEKAG